MTSVSAESLPRAYSTRMTGHRANKMLKQTFRCQLLPNWLICAGRATIQTLQQEKTDGGSLRTVTGSRTQILEREEILVGLVDHWISGR